MRLALIFSLDKSRQSQIFTHQNNWHPVNNFNNLLCHRCQLCASWSHGHSSYYVLHFYKLIFRNKSEEFPRRHFTFSFGKMRSNYFVALGAIGPQDKPLYNHNQKKSSSSSSSLLSQSKEILLIFTIFITTIKRNQLQQRQYI